MKIVLQSNITKVSQRYQRIARNLPGIVDAAIQSLARDEGIPLFQNTTRTWQHKPTFETIKQPRGWAIKTTDQIYNWVDQGTRPHTITAKNVPFLVFRYPYRSATVPNVISSRAAARGNNWARKRSVQHPGTEARNFTDIIIRRLQQRAANRVRQALNDASYGAGAGL